ncbi:MAG: hypothetical protein KC519_15850, partial [Anaerolineae bacterium]|nr:hypothetical protein [Anaerolineae bacterium]
RYDDAEILFYDRINYATLYRLSAARQRIEMLERLFPDGLDQLPRLSKPDMQAFTLSALGTAYVSGGQPERAAPQFARANDIYATMTRSDYLSIGLGNLSNALRLSSELYEAEHSARRALVLTHEPEDSFWKAINLYWLGLALAARGDGDGREQSNARNGADALTAFRRALRLFRSQNEYEGVTYAYLAQRAAWRGEYASARRLADHAWELAHYWRFERDFIRAACRQGQAALGLSEFNVADDRLHHALTRARAVNDAENELSALTSLAELRRRQRNLDDARELLDQVWEGAARGPYPLEHADALNVLAQIERDAGNTDAAIQAATQAYTKAWCDGISADGSQCYAYWWGLQAAKAHLAALGAPVPDLQPFTLDGREPMPEVEIDPGDEYHVGDRAVEDEV